MNRISYLIPILGLPLCLTKANATIIVSTSTDLCSVQICPPPPTPKSTFNGGLIINGDFGDGNFTGFSGTLTKNTDKTQGGIMGNSNYPYSYAYLASAGSDQTLYQTFTTTPGDVYSISFTLDNFNQGVGAGQAYDFTAGFGGQSLLSFTNPTFPDGSSTTYNFTDVADSYSTTLLFTARNDPGSFSLTNISVFDSSAVTPEPSSLVLLGTGAVSLLGLAKRRARPLR